MTGYGFDSPRPLHWTTDPPRVPGWFWLDLPPRVRPEPTLVADLKGRLVAMLPSPDSPFWCRLPVTAAPAGARWAGPIPQPADL